MYPFWFNREDRIHVKILPTWQFSRRHQFSRKKSQSQLWTAVIVSCCSFFLMVKGILSSYKCTAFSGEEIRAHRYGQKVCLHIQPPSHFSQHHIVSFWRKLKEFRDCLRQGPLPSPGRRDKGRRCVPTVLFPGQVLPSLVQPSYSQLTWEPGKASCRGQSTYKAGQNSSS